MPFFEILHVNVICAIFNTHEIYELEFRKMYFTCFFLIKTLKFRRVKAKISCFERVPVHLAEIMYIYSICFTRFSWEILLISTGTLSKLKICGLTLGNFSVFFQKWTCLNTITYLHSIDEDKLLGNIIAKNFKRIYYIN